MPESKDGACQNVDRRSLIKGVAAAIALPVISGLTGHEVAALGLETHAMHSGQGQIRAQTISSVLSPGQRRLLGQVTETILPRTETPGASDAGVVPFIEGMLDGWFPADAKNRYLSNLDAFDDNCRQAYGKDFVDCDHQQQALRIADAEQAAVQARDGKRFTPDPLTLAQAEFFDVTKWLAVFGYFTSQRVLQDTLGYRIVPGRYDGAAKVAR